MAAPTNKSCRAIYGPTTDSLIYQLTTQLNNTITALRIVTAKLDLDAGVTDTTYDSLSTASGVATAPCKIDLVLG
jgi:hypothetical protein